MAPSDQMSEATTAPSPRTTSRAIQYRYGVPTTGPAHHPAGVADRASDLGEAKVAELALPVRGEEDVGALDIAVDDSVLVQVVGPLQDLQRVPTRHPRVQPTKPETANHFK